MFSFHWNGTKAYARVRTLGIDESWTVTADAAAAGTTPPFSEANQKALPQHRYTADNARTQQMHAHTPPKKSHIKYPLREKLFENNKVAPYLAADSPPYYLFAIRIQSVR